MTTHPCESCSMPIETGRYCAHCVGPDGRLSSFDERFGRMVDWQARRHPEQSRDEVEAATLRFMATLPAWQDTTTSPGGWGRRGRRWWAG